MKQHLIASMAILVSTVGFSQVSGNPGSIDPLVGEWIWQGNAKVVVHPDGTAENKRNHDQGTWKFLQNKELERKYEFYWQSKGRIFVDRLTLSRDGKNLEGRNQQSKRVSAKRTTSPSDPRK